MLSHNKCTATKIYTVQADDISGLLSKGSVTLPPCLTIKMTAAATTLHGGLKEMVFSPCDMLGKFIPNQHCFFSSQVRATRPDGSYEGLVYRIKSATADGTSKFTIDAETGVINAKAVDYESVDEYLLFVEAEDRNSEPFRWVLWKVSNLQIWNPRSCINYISGYPGS